MFFNQAYAEDTVTAVAAKAGVLTQFLPLAAILLIFYFLLIRPQQRRAREHQSMLKAIKKGDKVVTSGGIVAVVYKNVETDPFILAEIAEGVRVKIKRETITELLSADTSPAPIEQEASAKDGATEGKKSKGNVKGNKKQNIAK